MNVVKQVATLMPFRQPRPSLLSRLSAGVEECRLLASLHRQGLFYGGLGVRLLLILLAIPQIQQTWFIPFITLTLQPPTFNPWANHLTTGGDPLAFPYGVVMYLAYLPLTALGWGLDQLLSTTWLAKVGFGLTSLVFDYGLFIGIALLARQYSAKLLLVTYWCSPLVVYILYWHGQLDALPVCLLAWGLCLLQRQRPRIAGVVLGCALSAKFSMVAALPFIAIYLYRNRRLRPELPPLIGATALTLAVTVLPLLASSAFVVMVLRTPEAARIYAVFLSYGPDLKLFLLPTVYILALYLVWRLERITLDLFIISVGLGFFALLLLLPPGPGWFLWVMPFLVFYQLRSQGDYLLTTLPFFCFYLIYNLLYATGAEVPMLGLSLSQPLATGTPIADSHVQSILFTGLQATALLICVRMYIFGVRRNNYYRKSRAPLVVGIAGDSGAGKDTLVAALTRLLGAESVAHVRGDDYHKWERHHPMWSAKTHLNPHANNLSRLTRDVFTLAEGKPIWSRHYDHQSGKFTGPRKIASADLVVVSGLHSLYIKRLRDRLDLKIFLDSDEDLRLHWKRQRDTRERGHDGAQVTLALEQRRPDSAAFIQSQARYADLLFKLAPVNPDILRGSQPPGRIPRLKLFVTMANGFFHEELVHSLIALCGMHIDLEQSPHLDCISLCIEGDATGEDLAQVASLLIPNLEDLVPCQPGWESGPTGLMQLITLVHISDLLHRGNTPNYA
jgi:uridine kinase